VQAALAGGKRAVGYRSGCGKFDKFCVAVAVSSTPSSHPVRNSGVLSIFVMWMHTTTTLRVSSMAQYCSGVVWRWGIRLGRPAVPSATIAQYRQLLAELQATDTRPTVQRDPTGVDIVLALWDVGAPLDVCCASLFGCGFGLRGCEYLYTSPLPGMAKKRLLVKSVTVAEDGTITIIIYFRKANVTGARLVLTRRRFSGDERLCISRVWQRLRAARPASGDDFAFREASGAPLRASTVARWLRRAAVHAGRPPSEA